MYLATININFKDCLVLVSVVSIIAILFLIYMSHNKIEFLDNKTDDCVQHLSSVSNSDSPNQNTINLGQNSLIQENKTEIQKTNAVLASLETKVSKLQSVITKNKSDLDRLQKKEASVEKKLQQLGKKKKK